VSFACGMKPSSITGSKRYGSDCTNLKCLVRTPLKERKKGISSTSVEDRSSLSIRAAYETRRTQTINLGGTLRKTNRIREDIGFIGREGKILLSKEKRRKTSLSSIKSKDKKTKNAEKKKKKNHRKFPHLWSLRKASGKRDTGAIFSEMGKRVTPESRSGEGTPLGKVAKNIRSDGKE